jgi:hypothetical protein
MKLSGGRLDGTVLSSVLLPTQVCIGENKRGGSTPGDGNLEVGGGGGGDEDSGENEGYT